MTARFKTASWLCVVILALLLPLGLTAGGVDIPAAEIWKALTGSGDETTQFIVAQNRLPALLTAMFAGAALSVAGLQMQTCFNNPLAGPSIMGISGGASVGVALVMLLLGGLMGFWGRLAVIAGAFAGAAAVMVILLVFSSFVRSGDVLLIVGVLIGYLASSLISILNYFAPEHGVYSFVMWGMGTFSTVDLRMLPCFAGLCAGLCAVSFILCKSMNALLLGTDYAHSAGVDVRRTRTWLLLISSSLTAVVTAWCGPIGFIGLVVPHIARLATDSSNHRTLLPVTLMAGAILGLACQIISVWPSRYSGTLLPVNAITPVLGIPVIVYVLLNRKKLLYFS